MIGVERDGSTIITSGTSKLEIEYDGIRSELVRLSIDAAAPAVFSLDQSGSGQGAILNAGRIGQQSAQPGGAG